MATKNETQTKLEDVDAEGAEQAAAAPGRRLPFKLILIAAGGLVALVAAGGVADHVVGSHGASATAWRCASRKPGMTLAMFESAGGSGNRMEAP
jgi:hypothetical protein